MTEEEVRQIAQEFVVNQGLGKCSVISVRRFCRADIPNPSTIGDEWVIQFQFENDGTYAPECALVIVDDATGEPTPFETL
jgi:hypothetical protein